VTVLGYRTDTFPAFYLTSSGLPVTWRVETPAEAAAVLRARLEVGAPGAVVVANPLDEQMDPALHERVLLEGLQSAAEAGVSGRDVTPFVLERFHSRTEGESLRANVRLVLRNAALAAEIAAA
jgi:pseudouridine-5'-phosphate glycosidase